jgi:ribonuclease Z
MEKAHGGKVHIKAVQIVHTVPTVGFVLEEDAVRGSIDAAKATALGLPPCPEYEKLKSGLDVELENGTVIRSADVVAAPCKGRKLVILGDTSDPFGMQAHAMGADLLVHEATVEDNPRTARARGHSTPHMAGTVAKALEAKRLVLTHFSGKLDRGTFRPQQQWAVWPSGALPPHVSCMDQHGVRQSVPPDRFPPAAALVDAAASAFGARAVLAAHDFLTILVPRGGFSK